MRKEKKGRRPGQRAEGTADTEAGGTNAPQTRSVTGRPARRRTWEAGGASGEREAGAGRECTGHVKGSTLNSSGETEGLKHGCAFPDFRKTYQASGKARCREEVRGLYRRPTEGRRRPERRRLGWERTGRLGAWPLQSGIRSTWRLIRSGG